MVNNNNYNVRLRSFGEENTLLLSEVEIKAKNYDTFIFLHNAVKEILEKEEKNANKNNQQND